MVRKDNTQSWNGYLWANPPAPFNPDCRPEVVAAYKRHMERIEDWNTNCPVPDTASDETFNAALIEFANNSYTKYRSECGS